MIDYQVRYLGREGHLLQQEEIHCENDRAAILAARSLLGAHDVELWSGAQMVVRLRGLNSIRADAGTEESRVATDLFSSSHA